MSKIFLWLIDFYQRYISFDTGILSVLAPGGACKYEERCSSYTKRQIVERGLGRGLLLGVKRIISCR